MNIKKRVSSLLTSISIALFFFILCTDPEKPDFTAPTIENGGKVQTYGNTTLNSTFGMFVSVTGTEPFTFQWLKDGSPITDEMRVSIADTLKRSPLTVEHNGVYQCIVTSDFGSDSSETFTLTVTEPPVIDSHPKPQSVSEGDTATFSLSASGTAPLSFQWQKDSINITGATDSIYTIDSTTMSDSGSVFRCIVSNSAGADTSNGARLDVNSSSVAPTITNQPQPQSVSEGQTATFSVIASGTAPLSYQWQKNNSNISGATDTSYTTPATVVADSGSVFRCIVSNSVGVDTSDGALLQVSLNPIAPTIITQPQLQSVTEGQTATFTITATGTTPLNYQWQKGNTNITGATSTSYTTPVTALTDSGTLFRCIVSNSVGTDTSDNAMLLVSANPVAPTITTQPTEQTVTEGQTASFSITATGTTPLTYQWQKGNTNITGATSASYTTPVTVLSDSGTLFRCIVSNSVGADTSDNAMLKVNKDVIAPTITTQPVLQSVKEGQTATFSVRADGTAPLSYQWQKDDTNISGAIDSNYTTPATTLSDSGSQFRCIVSNSAGTDTSDKALLQVSTNPIVPTITTQPTQQSVTEGGTATFTVAATGTAPLAYQWQKGGVDISGATDTTYTTPATVLTDSGSVFRCIVSNSAGADTSNNALLIVNSAPVKPTITVQPKPNAALEGKTATFSVAATGTAPLSYQWQKGGTDISGATNANYTTPAVTKLENGAVYRCIVSNSVGKDTSDNAILTVNLKKPVITVDPSDQSILEDATASFSITATGTDLTFQWQKNNSNISGATNSTYTTPATTMADDGATFRCIAINAGGKDTSTAATLTVNMKAPIITNDPDNVNKNEGQSASFYVTATGTDLHYEWQRNGSPIASAPDQDSYTFTTTWQDNGATFRCRVYNAGGSVNSQAADLIVTHTPKITVQPVSDNKRINDVIVFSVTAIGNPSALSYQWYFNDVAITNATTSTYTINSIEPIHDGVYHVFISNSLGNIQSNDAVLSVAMEMQDSRDGQVYKVVQIGNQIWMAENLNYEPTSGGSWCYGDDPSNCDTYGRLYNWTTAVNQCPTGWRLPSDVDWNTLTDNAGGLDHAGFVLKSNEGWNSDYSIDSLDYKALPAGTRSEDGSYSGILTQTVFWTSVEVTSEFSGARYMGAGDDAVRLESHGKGRGLSVRCIKE